MADERISRLSNPSSPGAVDGNSIDFENIGPKMGPILGPCFFPLFLSVFPIESVPES